MIPKGFGYRGGGRKGLAARSGKAPKKKIYKQSKSPKLGFNFK